MNKFDISLYSLNTRGLADRRKRTVVFSWLKDQAATIFFLQETHSTPDVEKLWIKEWGSPNMFFLMERPTVKELVFYSVT